MEFPGLERNSSLNFLMPQNDGCATPSLKPDESALIFSLGHP